MTFSDPLDEAAEREQQRIAVSLANRKKPAPRSLVCLNGDCGEPSQSGSNYCSRECCEDHAKELHALKNRRVA